VIKSESKLTFALDLPANKITLGDIHGRHIKDESKEIGHGGFTFDGSTFKIGDAAFIPAKSQYLQYSRANTNSTIYTTRNTRE
jgi:hypothetical protein